MMVNFASLWDGIDTPWADSTFAEGRQMNSRRSSGVSDIYVPPSTPLSPPVQLPRLFSNPPKQLVFACNSADTICLEKRTPPPPPPLSSSHHSFVYFHHQPRIPILISTPMTYAPLQYSPASVWIAP